MLGKGCIQDMKFYDLLCFLRSGMDMPVLYLTFSKQVVMVTHFVMGIVMIFKLFLFCWFIINYESYKNDHSYVDKKKIYSLCHTLIAKCNKQILINIQ